MKALWLLVIAVLVAWRVRAEEPPRLVVEVHSARLVEREVLETLKPELARDAPLRGGHLTIDDAPHDIVRIRYVDEDGAVALRELRLAADDPQASSQVTLAVLTLLQKQDDLLAALEGAGAQAAPASSASAHTSQSFRAGPEGAQRATQVFDPCAPSPADAVAFDFSPFVGSSSSRSHRRAARHFSLSVLGSVGGSLRGVAVGLGVGVERFGLCGVDVELVSIVRGRAVGVQGGGLFNYARAGVAGIQVGALNIALAESRGLQLGLLNWLDGDARGGQIGMVNVARGEVGFALGLVNIARRARAPIGLLNFIARGRSSVDAWVTENGTLLVGGTHGGDYVHNLYGVGTRFGPHGSRFVATVGIGARAHTHGAFSLDVDLFTEELFEGPRFVETAWAIRGRLACGLALGRHLALLLAPGYAFMHLVKAQEPTQAFVSREVGRGGHGKDVVFPSLALGLRVPFGIGRL